MAYHGAVPGTETVVAEQNQSPDPPAWLSATPLFFVFMWSTGFIGAGLSMPHAEPFTFLTVRFASVVPLMAFLALILRSEWPRGIDVFHAFLVGAVIHGIYLGAVFWVVHAGMPAGISALIVGLQPIATAFVAGWVLGERLEAKHWTGLVLGLFGVILVLWPKLNLQDSGITATTVVVGFLGVFCLTAGSLYQKRFATRINLVTGAVWQYVGAAVASGLIALVTERLHITWNLDVFIALVWLVLALSIGAVSLYMVMLRHGQVTRVAAVFYLVPGTAAAIAWLMFGETLSIIQILGMAVCTFGVALATREK
ncbi:MAG: DMT family transporter [Pseudomonadota bacterium]